MAKWIKTKTGKAHEYINIDAYEKIKIEDQNGKFSVVALKGDHREVLFESQELPNCISFCRDYLLVE